MAGTPSTIFIEPVGGKPFARERLAAAAFTPGHLLMITSAGLYQKHNVAAGNCQKIFAMESLPEAGDIDRAYVANETARGGYANRGDRVYGWVAASAAAIAVGDALESAGDGTLRKQTANAATSQAQRDSVVGYAVVAVDNSGGGSPARIQFEVA